MQNSVLETIATRRSHRAYTTAQITEEQLQAILQAGLQSPSAVNRQPWHFSVVQNAALLDQLNGMLKNVMASKPENQRSPRFQDDSFHVFYHAPTVIFLFGDEQSSWTLIDCGIAVQNMTLAAESLGLGSVILGLPRPIFQGPDADEARCMLQCPEGYQFVIALAIGNPADTKEAHPQQADKISRII